MLTTAKDFEDVPNSLIHYGLLVFFAVIAAVALSRMAVHEVYAPAILAPHPVAHVHAATAIKAAPAYLRIRPRARPWYANTEGDWAARLGQCLHLPTKTIDTLQYQYHRGIAPAADFMHMYPYSLVSVSPSGTCRGEGTDIIRDRPKLGMLDVSDSYFVELTSLKDGSHLFAYRTE